MIKLKREKSAAILEMKENIRNQEADRVTMKMAEKDKQMLEKTDKLSVEQLITREDIKQ